MKSFTLISRLLQFSLAICLTLGLTGCATHFYRQKGDLLHIYLKTPDAETVTFAHSKDGFKLHPAEHIDSDTWRVTLPGEYEFTYFYMIDGKPFLPPCRFTEKDDFGSENCIFVPDM